MFKNLHIWIPSYLKHAVIGGFPLRKYAKPKHVFFCFADHFEPDWSGADEQTQNKRINAWLEKYPVLAKKHKDADGCSPKHTFFYPAETYNRQHIEKLKKLCAQGFGEIEVHLHHDNDTGKSLRHLFNKAKKDFTADGLLGKNKRTNAISFGFIHGNWALNNSRKDGRWCGVNNETTILREEGCYADFTLPSAPSDTQTSKVNSIYYDTANNPNKPKSHNTGVNAQVGKTDTPGLLLIQGPLALNWKKRKWGIFPRIENSDITGVNPPTKDRIDLWVKQNICIKKRREWIFIKVHSHGAVEKNAMVLLGEPLDRMFNYLESKYNDGKNFILHYVTAREMYNIIKAAEHGESGDPNLYRDYEIVANLYGQEGAACGTH